jgi:putative MFS transporter
MSSRDVSKVSSDPAIRAAVLVAALGYFVDVYDIALFSIIRVPSLKDLGLSDDRILYDGVTLLNLQMGGMLLGGILWGILGDKLGRIQVLFGSILMYSIANIANAFVHDMTSYSICRFFAGLGLAGEIGAGITLVSEMMPKNRRGLATTIVAAVGVSGAMAAALIGDLLHWRTAYMVGGVGGFALLALRVGVYESGMFNAVKEDGEIAKGDLTLLFRDGRLWRYVSCICVGVPMFFFIALLMTLAPEIGKALNMSGELRSAQAILCYSIGITLGDVGSGLLSQYLQSRKKVLGLFLVSAAITMTLMVVGEGRSPQYYYTLSCLGGFSIGYWAVLVTTSAEQFGTNVRATVTSTVPNFVRGSTVAITLLFEGLKPYIGTIDAVKVVGLICYGFAFVGWYALRETFHADLNFVERGGVANSDVLTTERQLPEEKMVGNW